MCCTFFVTLQDLDPAMMRLLMQAGLTEEEKDISEAEINKFGGLKAVQRELRNIGTLLSSECFFYVFFNNY